MSETGSGAGSESGSGAGEHVASVTESEIVTVVTVAMAVALSFSLNVLERGIKRFKYSTVMLKMIFRETMIVGIVSAFMYGLERTDNQIEHDQVCYARRLSLSGGGTSSPCHSPQSPGIVRGGSHDNVLVGNNMYDNGGA